MGQLKFSWLEESAVKDGSRKREELFWNCFCKLAAVVAFWVFQRGEEGELGANILYSGLEVAGSSCRCWDWPSPQWKILSLSVSLTSVYLCFYLLGTTRFRYHSWSFYLLLEEFA